MLYRFVSILAVVVSTLVVVITTNAAYAQSSSDSLSEEQKQQIVSNCVGIRNSLNQLHASDALLRVNRGQVYESMATKLMDKFNARLISNSLDAKAMTTVTDNYRAALLDFRADYITYEQKLSETLRIDCTKHPEAFYISVQSTRELRLAVHEDVQRLHRFIDDYRSSVGDFLLNYQRVAG